MHVTSRNGGSPQREFQSTLNRTCEGTSPRLEAFLRRKQIHLLFPWGVTFRVKLLRSLSEKGASQTGTCDPPSVSARSVREKQEGALVRRTQRPPRSQGLWPFPRGRSSALLSLGGGGGGCRIPPRSPDLGQNRDSQGGCFNNVAAGADFCDRARQCKTPGGC